MYVYIYRERENKRERERQREREREQTDFNNYFCSRELEEMILMGIFKLLQHGVPSYSPALKGPCGVLKNFIRSFSWGVHGLYDALALHAA